MKKNGFTLIELVVVVSIIVILSAVAVVSFISTIDEAENSTGIANIKNIDTFITTRLILGDFEGETLYTYRRSQSGNEQYLSRFLEANWEVLNGSGDSDNSNSLNIINSFSRKTGVVNWTNPESLSSLYHNQALYITSSDAAAYTPGSPTTVNDCFKGSAVIWYDGNSASNIYLYFVDKEGLQSDKHYIY